MSNYNEWYYIQQWRKKDGAKGYKHNYSDSAKRSFRARHHCKGNEDKLTASYWACRVLWPANKKTTNPTAKKNTGK